MPPQVLRDYQVRGLAEIMARFREGARSVLAVSPTGSGKTTIFGHLAHQLDAGGRRVLIVVHRRELAEQAARRLTEFGVRFGIIMAGFEPTPYARVQIASVQTLVRRKAPPADLVICDEAHLSTAETWHRVLECYPNARILGVTATPWRLGGKPLAGAYDACVVVATPRELREAGHLCDFVGFSYLTPDLSGIKSKAGDYNEAQSAAAMGQSLIVDSTVEEYGKHAAGMSAVLFAVTVQHSRDLVTRFKAAGISAEHLDGETALEQRRAILRRVAEGRTLVLSNVGVVIEGLDVPRLKVCILNRPTKSLARAIQMMGRVRRPWNGQVARIHDHAFVIKQHGLPDAERDFTLIGKPENPPSLTTCDVCRALYSGRSCPSCSHENAPPPPTERKLATVADAEQFQFDSGSDQIPDSSPRATSDIRWSAPGRSVEGRFTETWEEPGAQFNPRRYRIAGKRRDYVLPGTAMLDAKLRSVPVGSIVRITYTQDTPLGGFKHRKEFRVEVDDGT